MTSTLPTDGVEDLLPTSGVGALVALEELYSDCDACEELCASRSQVVFGSGSAHGPIMIIAEAPGSDEDQEGVAMIGKSGRLLMELLVNAWPESEEVSEILAIDEEEGELFYTEARDYLDDFIFWTNIVLCKPEENRDPSPAERKACRDRLHRTIYAVDPLVIIGVGKLAVGQLLRAAVQITKKRGYTFDISVPSPVTGLPVRYTLLALLHPAYLVRQGDQDLLARKGQGPTYETLEDLKYVLGLLQKHSSYALKNPFPQEEDPDV